ncbi:diiron oxygenase [Paraburkholderia tropica]|uniref:diiron oxygenase n=1 Tax=Paraburkholderia tropica TaxID=92647 RepID=UPI002AB7AE05|nr:diiron oxygenase [Paraburkholderia tropica]
MEALQKLITMSRERHYNVYERFDWPEQVPEDVLWCDESLLTTYGTPYHERLDDRQRIALSKWEAINFYSLNVHGIKDALAFVCEKMYSPRYAAYWTYLHHFLDEENAHMWFFARFCNDYGGKIYKTLSLKADGSHALLNDLYMFASTLIFEEFVDYYNHKVGNNPHVPPIVREINHQHHLDESRHVKFGRDVIKDLFEELRATDPQWDITQPEVDAKLQRIFLHFIGLMYNPSAYADAGIHEACRVKSAAALRNALRSAPERREHHRHWFRRTARYFESIGAISTSELF